MNVKNTGKFIVLFLITNSLLLCNSIKPRPDGDGWIKCPDCKGYGTIEVIDNRTSSRDKKSDEKAGSCLSPFSWTDTYDDYNRQSEMRRVDGTDAHKDNDPYKLRVKMKKVRCPNCNGRGWIKK